MIRPTGSNQTDERVFASDRLMKCQKRCDEKGGTIKVHHDGVR